MRWIDLVIAIIALLPSLAGGVIYWRHNHRQRELANQSTEVGIDHERVKIEIDEVTKAQLVQDAANANIKREQEREEWWSSQVRSMRGEIEEERRLSNRRFRRLNAVESWAMLHVAWDRKAWSKLLEYDPDFEPPPMLPEEEPWDALPPV